MTDLTPQQLSIGLLQTHCPKCRQITVHELVKVGNGPRNRSRSKIRCLDCKVIHRFGEKWDSAAKREWRALDLLKERAATDAKNMAIQFLTHGTHNRFRGKERSNPPQGFHRDRYRDKTLAFEHWYRVNVARRGVKP